MRNDGKMQEKELITKYQKDSRFIDFFESWSTENKGNTIPINGLSGSSIPLIAACTFVKSGKSWIIIRREKEEAAYFFNDLEKLLGSQRVVFFSFSPLKMANSDNQSPQQAF